MMNEIRSWDFSTKKNYYLNARICDQLDWYTEKAAHNSRMSKAFFVAVIIMYALGLCWASLQLSNPNWELRWVSEPLIVLAAGLVGYSEARRYAELSTSYELAKFEISRLKSEYLDCSDDANLMSLIDDSEQAFSREHTQWIARRA